MMARRRPMMTAGSYGMAPGYLDEMAALSTYLQPHVPLAFQSMARRRLRDMRQPGMGMGRAPLLEQGANTPADMDDLLASLTEQAQAAQAPPLYIEEDELGALGAGRTVPRTMKRYGKAGAYEYGEIPQFGPPADADEIVRRLDMARAAREVTMPYGETKAGGETASRLAEKKITTEAETERAKIASEARNRQIQAAYAIIQGTGSTLEHLRDEMARLKAKIADPATAPAEKKVTQALYEETAGRQAAELKKVELATTSMASALEMRPEGEAKPEPKKYTRQEGKAVGFTEKEMDQNAQAFEPRKSNVAGPQAKAAPVKPDPEKLLGEMLADGIPLENGETIPPKEVATVYEPIRELFVLAPTPEQKMAIIETLTKAVKANHAKALNEKAAKDQAKADQSKRAANVAFRKAGLETEPGYKPGLLDFLYRGRVVRPSFGARYGVAIEPMTPETPIAIPSTGFAPGLYNTDWLAR